MSVFQKARELGEALHDSEPFLHMIDLEKRIQEDAEAKRLLDLVTSLESDVKNMMSSGDFDRAIMDEMVAEVKEARYHAEANALLTEHRQAQAEFARLMQQVNEVLAFFVTGKTANTSSSGCSGCGGGCSSCSGKCDATE